MELPIESIELDENHGKFNCVLIVGRDISMELFKNFLTQVNLDKVRHITISHLAEGPCTNTDLLDAANEFFKDTGITASLDDKTLVEKLEDYCSAISNERSKVFSKEKLGEIGERIAIKKDYKDNTKWYKQFGRKKGKGKVNRY